MLIDIEKLLKNVQNPAAYVGGEVGCVQKDPASVDIRFAMCFPDTYAIGMSNLAVKILYTLINRLPYAYCERAFSPWVDMRERLLETGTPLYSLETLSPLSDFDIIGFTLGYELCYTNVLDMLHLGGIPVKACDREGLKNLVIAGGNCCANPEPMSVFIDIFVIGDGEEVTVELLDLYKKYKVEGSSKQEFLKAADKIEGIYVPSLYDVSYNEDSTVKAVTHYTGEPKTVRKRYVENLDDMVMPDFILPYSKVVHDRIMTEVMRGCIRGCRFCQAGFITRPLRPRSPECIIKSVELAAEQTGYSEVSLNSLSTSDYPKLHELLDGLIDYTKSNNINLSLPSMRIDNFSEELLAKTRAVRESGLTFAPEAGTQRLRDVINKNVTEEQVMKACRIAFSGGKASVKLYFMISLPTETDEDVAGIIGLAKKVLDIKRANISISAATFVPKPHTPFQWAAQDSMEEIERKQKILLDTVRSPETGSRSIRVSWHSPKTSRIEALLARGDRKVGAVIYDVWQAGGVFDAWDDIFDYDRYEQACAANDIDISFYVNRVRSDDEVFSWQHISFGVPGGYLLKEWRAANE